MIELWRWEIQPGETFTSPGHPATTFELLRTCKPALTLTLGETCRTVAAENRGGPHRNRARLPQWYAPLVFTMTVAELPSLTDIMIQDDDKTHLFTGLSPESLLAQVTTLIEQDRLGEVLQSAIRKGTTLTAIKRCISTPRT